MSENGFNGKKTRTDPPASFELRKRIADGVREGFQASMGPVNEKFAALAEQQNQTAMVVNAVVGLLVEKGFLTEAEVAERATSLMQEARREQEARKRGAAAAKAAASSPPPPAPEPDSPG